MASDSKDELPIKLTESSYRVMRWKNGLGSTCQFAIHPPNSSVDDLSFDWRLSSAVVNAGSSPFSLFPGFDRVLLTFPLPGVVASQQPILTLHTISPPSPSSHAATATASPPNPVAGVFMLPLQPTVFSGDARTVGEATLVCRDFNVITRRSAFSARCSVFQLTKAIELQVPEIGVFVAYCVSGKANVTIEASLASTVDCTQAKPQPHEVELAAHEMMRLDRSAQTLHPQRARLSSNDAAGSATAPATSAAPAASAAPATAAADVDKRESAIVVVVWLTPVK